MTAPVPVPKESPAPPDEGLTDLLSEIRLLVPGTLILVAFLIALPFNSGYTTISRLENAVYVALFICAMISLLIFIAPAAQHRLMSPLTDRAAFKRSVNRQVIIGLMPPGRRDCGRHRGAGHCRPVVDHAIEQTPALDSPRVVTRLGVESLSSQRGPLPRESAACSNQI
jgi:hypothetical protein